jgi:DNA ligase-associated metallophosphoesterase
VRWGDTLFVADVHWGKTATFRRMGIPVPLGDLDEDLGRMDALVTGTGVRRVVVLGDLVHARVDDDVVEAVAAWRRARPVEMVLVRGNHDRHQPRLPAAWGIEDRQGPWRLGPFALVHAPVEIDGAYTLAGHVHPAVRVAGRGDALTLPCFHFGRAVGILPAFGTFTGGVSVRRAPGDRVYAIAGKQVRPV